MIKSISILVIRECCLSNIFLIIFFSRSFALGFEWGHCIIVYLILHQIITIATSLHEGLWKLVLYMFQRSFFYFPFLYLFYLFWLFDLIGVNLCVKLFYIIFPCFRCFDPDPDNRATAQELLDDPFLVE